MYGDELRMAFRGLARSRGFLYASVLVLSLGLGANFVLFNTIYAPLWRPLPFPQPERLVTVNNDFGGRRSLPALRLDQALVVPEWVPSVLAAGLFERSPFGTSGTFALTRGFEPVAFWAIRVNSEYFRALGIQPLAGRFLGEEEDRGENPETRAVIGESSWRTYFGADGSVINQVFPFEHDGKREQVRVVGIVPDNAFLNKSIEEPQLFIPLPYSVAPLRDLLVPTNRQAMFFLYGASCLLLLLTCANVADMFLVRYLERTRDIAVRMTLGAPLSRVLCLNFQEVLLICMMGTAAAFGLVRLLQPTVNKFLPEVQNVGAKPLTISWVVAGVGLLACVAIALAVAVTPLWIIRLTDLRAVLNLSGREKTGRRRWWQVALVTGQIAIAMLLLVVAGLLTRSFTSALEVDSGFDPRHVFAFHATFSAAGGTVSPDYELSDLVSGLPVRCQN